MTARCSVLSIVLKIDHYTHWISVCCVGACRRIIECLSISIAGVCTNNALIGISHYLPKGGWAGNFWDTPRILGFAKPCFVIFYWHVGIKHFVSIFNHFHSHCGFLSLLTHCHYHSLQEAQSFLPGHMWLLLHSTNGAAHFHFLGTLTNINIKNINVDKFLTSVYCLSEIY